MLSFFPGTYIINKRRDPSSRGCHPVHKSYSFLKQQRIKQPQDIQKAKCRCIPFIIPPVRTLEQSRLCSNFRTVITILSTHQSHLISTEGGSCYIPSIVLGSGAAFMNKMDKEEKTSRLFKNHRW